MALVALHAAQGCSSSARTSAPPADEGVTFTKTIEPLVQDKCQTCHREGGIAPFSLVTYEDVKAMGAVARDKVARREMPPWAAYDDDDCTMSRGFKDDLGMTEEQIDTFVAWVDAGMPLGDPAPSKRVAPRTFTDVGLPNKTHTFEIAEPYLVEPTGKDDTRCFRVDPGFTEDTWVGGTNFVPGDPRIVHHALVYVDPDNEAEALADGASSYPCFGGPRINKQALLMAWAPGVSPAHYVEGAGLRIPKGARIVMQIHYHPGREAVTDRTKIELETLRERPRFIADILLVGNADRGGSADGVSKLLPGPDDPASGPAFVIPANAKGHTETMEAILPARNGSIEVPPLKVYATGSHMHWAGVDMEITVDRKTPAPGQPAKECLLGTPKYDFSWQRHYAYDVPFEELPVITPGDKLGFRCTYDNTRDNPRVAKFMAEERMSRPPEIRLGETAKDEMCQGILVVVSEKGFRE